MYNRPPIDPQLTDGQLQNLDALTQGLTGAQLRFFYHLVGSTQGRVDKAELKASRSRLRRDSLAEPILIPASARYINKHFLESKRGRTEPVWDELKARKLIRVHVWDAGKKLSRRFELLPPVLDALREPMGASGGTDGISFTEPLLSASTREGKRGRPPTCSIAGPGGNGRRLEPLLSALRVHNTGRRLVNVEAFWQAYEKLQHDHHCKEQRRDQERRKVSTKDADPDDVARVEKVYYVPDWKYTERHVRHFIESVRRRKPERCTEGPSGTIEYHPHYAVQEKSGRITELSAQQGLKRELKAACLQGIDRVCNYDIESSQLNGLIDVALKLEVDHEAAEHLSANRSRLAADLNVPEKVLKRGIYATVFGSHLINYRKWGNEMSASPLLLAFEELDPTWYRISNDARATRYGALLHELLPLRNTVREVGDRLWEQAVAAESKNKLARNACGIVLRPSFVDAKILKKHPMPTSNRPRVLAAWRRKQALNRRKATLTWKLQGLEAGYIHHLTAMAEHKGFEVIGNEHDGLITLGEIPECAMAQARDKSGFFRARLAKKPISG